MVEDDNHSDHKNSISRCPYHRFSKEHPIQHNSPVKPDRFDMKSFLESSANKTKNISHEMMFNKNAFKKQSFFYQGTHQQFMFFKPKVGDRADRVYSYYAYRDDWNKDNYLKKSQEADNKDLQSREGRKLNLGAYNARMRVSLMSKKKNNMNEDLPRWK